MTRRAMPDQAVLKELLDFDPTSGTLWWKARLPKHFPGTCNPEHACARWNGKFTGRRAFATDRGNGYFGGNLFDRDSYAHRVVWKWATGEEPDQIDHIDGNGFNNKLTNLRAVGYSENTKNQRLRRDNKSGHAGVRWEERPGRKPQWFVYIRVGGRMRFLGYFDNLSAAVACRKAAERKYGYHANHGKAR